MKANFSISSIIPMLHFLQNLKNNQADKKHLSEIFNHQDYDFEFRRYEISSKEPLVDYFMHLRTINESEIPQLNLERKNMLRNKHKLWLAAYENPEYYEALYAKINNLVTDETLEDICMRVKRGLPANISIDKIRMISTMSIGTSFGYVFDGTLHFDLMGFDNDRIDNLPSLVAHEIHHLAMQKYVSTFLNSLTLEERYIFSFSGEGLAVKFCNNAKGTISKAIDNKRPENEGLDGFSMNYLNAHFNEALSVFKETLIKIRTGRINKADVFTQLENYWWSLYTQEQNRNEEPQLKHSMIYSFGNDLFGTIYDAYGAEILFDCVRYPLKAVKYFEQATK